MKNHIKYPTGKPFSLKMLLSQQNLIKSKDKKITKVGLFLKVKRELAKGNLKVVGKKINGRGRPQFLYRRVEMPSVQNAPEAMTA
ncbi:MAG: hypothetical protein WC567_03840 [Kiritimatiellia bacterium]|jgi:hypothetical protein